MPLPYFSCCSLYLFPGDALLFVTIIIKPRSLGLLFLYHFHNNSETGGAHGRPIFASAAILLGRRCVAALILLRQAGQHHLPMLVPLIAAHWNLTLPMVVVEGTPQPVNPPVLPTRTRKRCSIVLCLYLVEHLLSRHGLLAYCGVRPKLIWARHHARLRRMLIPTTIRATSCPTSTNR